jgi:manganese/zinc/iron transport system permease protein
MEHVITPEIEELLVKELGNPELDPHQSPIPYEEA